MEEFIEDYIRFHKALKWMETEKSEARRAEQMPRFKSLQSNIDRTFAGFTDDQKNEVTLVLCANGYLPSMVIKILNIFKGTVTSLTSETFNV